MFIDLPARSTKPRSQGLTVVLDAGLPRTTFADLMESYGELIDIVKFGWGTALVTPGIEDKIRAARDNDVEICFGGTLFEKALVQERLSELRDYYRRHDCRYVEVSNGTIPLPNEEKAEHVRALSEEFTVISEVGFKQVERSLELSPAQWIEYVRQDLAAGAWRVVLEARESGRSGICRADGELRFGLINDLLNSGIRAGDLVFEAPTRSLQVYFVSRLGPDVNLGNVSASDIVGLETLRLGLRSDTLVLFQQEQAPVLRS